MTRLSHPVVSSHPSRASARKRAYTADETTAETTGPGRPAVTGQKKRARPGPPKSQNRPYDNRPRSGPARAARTSPDENAVRVVLRDEPPRLTPGAAQALLRILLKAAEGAAR